MSSRGTQKFIEKLYEIVSDSTITNIHWITKKRKDDFDKFIIHNPDNLCNDLKHLFNTRKAKSFVRQLHFYGFKKIGGTRHKEWVYYNKHFTVLGDELIDIRRNTHRNFDGIVARIEALEKKSSVETDILAKFDTIENKPPVESKPDLLARIKALERKPDLLDRIKALESKPDLLARIEALEGKPDLLAKIEALEKQNKELEKIIENMIYDKTFLSLQDDEDDLTNIIYDKTFLSLQDDEDDLTNMNFEQDTDLPI